MQFSVVAVCLGTVLGLVSFSVDGKSHSMMLTRIEKLSVDDEWIGEHKVEIAKMDKNTKVFNTTFKLKKEFNGDIVKIEMKIYQQAGNKYQKAPMDFPKQSLCGFFESNAVLWPCVQKHSNFPKQCPMPKVEKYCYLPERYSP